MALGAGVVIGLVLAGLLVIVALWVIFTYNRLVRLRVSNANGYSQIDVQLKRRADLIPNLVETVKGYAGHEKGTLEAVIAARGRAVSATAGPVAQRAAAEGELTQALGRLIAVAEAYPQLKADANFARLQEELASTENKIGFARQHYNDAAARYEGARQTFPSNIVAGAFNFKPAEFFQETNPAAREAPVVKF